MSLSEYEEWINGVIEARHRLQAHPNEKERDKTIMVHTITILENEIVLPLWDQNIQSANDRINIRVNPRRDLNSLGNLLEIISKELLTRYREEKSSR